MIVSDLAISMARVTTREQVKVLTWPPFQLLYVELVKSKEIPALRDLDEATKKKYWQEAKAVDRPIWKQIWIMQSLYMYDLMTKT